MAYSTLDLDFMVKQPRKLQNYAYALVSSVKITFLVCI